MPAPTNIAIIAGQLVVGGAERQLYLWLANLDRERFNPIVLTLHPGYGDYWEKPVEAFILRSICQPGCPALNGKESRWNSQQFRIDPELTGITNR